jgi:hypothetical protein
MIGASLIEILILLVAAVGLSPGGASSGKLELAYIAPEQCVVFLTWNGWKAPDPNSTNRTERLLAEESLKDFADQLNAEIEKLAGKIGVANDDASIAMVLSKAALTHPGAIYLSSFSPEGAAQLEAALVVDAGSDGEKVVGIIKKLIALAPQEGPQRAIEEKIGDATFFRPAEYRQNEPHFRFGYRGSQIVIALGDETAKTVVAKLAKPSEPPQWLTELTKELAVDRPSMLIHFNAQSLLKKLQPVINDPTAAKVFEATGLSKLKHISSLAGLDKTGMQFNTVLVTEGAPMGVFNLCPDKPLTIDTFRRVPANATHATVVRLDLAHVFEQALKMIEQVHPNEKQQIEAQLAQMQPQLGFSLKTDLLAALGDEWTIYASGTEAGLPFIPGLVLTANVRDHAKLNKTHETLVGVAKATVAQLGPQVPFSIQDFSSRGEKGYRLQFDGVPVPVAPTWVLTKEQFIVGLTPQLVTGHLASAGKASLADNAAVKAGFQWNPKPSFVSYSDPKAALQTIYGLVNTFSPVVIGQLRQQGIEFNLPPLPPLSDLEPHLAPSVTTLGRTANGWRMESHGVLPSGIETAPVIVGVGAALALPIFAIRSGHVRQQGALNNLKHIGLAMHNYHDGHRALPAAANVNKDGKALLSWRVHLLPYLDQLALYQQFHLDEPWDSEHNKPLIDRIPPIFVSPDSPALAKQGKTRYVVPRGKGTMFEGDADTTFQQIRDGLSNTLMAVEAHPDAAVIWTKPDDLVIDFKNPLKNLKGNQNNGFIALFADGSVRTISETINADTLKALFTKDGGERVGDF